MSGVNGIEGNGDIFMPENQREFRRFVLQSTNGKGVHFVMADGVSGHIVTLFRLSLD